VIEVVNAGDAVPEMTGATITFVMNAPAGDQQIRAAQTDYLHTLWQGLLENAGASSVTFIDMAPGEPGSDEQVPVVPLPDLPGTPVAPVPDPVDPEVYSCTLNTSAGFVPDTDTLLDEAAVRASLADCVANMTPGSKVHLDGWVAYFGEIGSDGRPVTDGDVDLSQRRCIRIKAVLVDMGVPEDAITTTGWGAVNQPDPEHPTSQNNRVVVITVTPPER
jgi:outer membrane protein OmpA-like peptidoglycan-associated protein